MAKLPAPGDGTWVGIAANANSGLGWGRRSVERLAEALGGFGITPRVAWTLDERAALVAESRVDPACRCLVAAGGDGTVAALVNERPTVPITVLSAGTENLFARHFRLPSKPERLARVIARGHVARIDLGQAGDRRFALMAGIGFDADVVTRHHRARVAGGSVKPTHRGAYVESVLRSSLEYRFPPLTVTLADEVLTATTAFVFNLPRYALGLPIAPTARADDGLLDLVLFRDPGPFRALHYLWLVVRGLHLRRPGVIHRRIARVAIHSPEPVPVQLDGDPGGTLGEPAWTIEVVPGALDVVVPSEPTR